LKATGAGLDFFETGLIFGFFLPETLLEAILAGLFFLAFFMICYLVIIGVILHQNVAFWQAYI
jgi:hypothetical protein